MKISINFNEFVTKFFTIFCVTVPISMFYNINSIPLTFIIFVFWLLFFILEISKNGLKRMKICQETLIIFLFSFIQNLVLIFFKYQIDFSSMFTFFVSLLICTIFVKSYFDKHLAFRFMKIISLFASILIIIQSISYNFFRVVISGYIPFLDTNYSHYTGIIENNLIFRPSSLFSEPAAFGIYVGTFLLMCVYKKNINFKQIVILVIGMLLSKSSFSLGLLIFTIFILFIKYYKWFLKSNKLPYIIIFIICIVFILNLSVTQEMILHVVDFSSNNVISDGLLGRIGNYSSIKELGIENIIFGSGFINNDFGYLTGIGNLIVNFGIIGIIIYFISLVSLYTRGTKMSKTFIFLMIYISVFSNSILGLQPLIYFPLIMITNDNFEKSILKTRRENLC